MIVIDSCGWIEYLGKGPKSAVYKKLFAKPSEIIVPTIVLFEVYKKVLREFGEKTALVVVSSMKNMTVAPLDEPTALLAADLSIAHSLPMADAVVYATAKTSGAKVATSDQHFKDLDGVIFI
jgi:predicted nucleic acid-binding protein